MLHIESASIEFQVTSDKDQLTDQCLEDLLQKVLSFVEREGYTVTDRMGEKKSCSSPRLFIHKR